MRSGDGPRLARSDEQLDSDSSRAAARILATLCRSRSVEMWRAARAPASLSQGRLRRKPYREHDR